MAYKFSAEELEPNAANWDRNFVFPVDTFKTAAGLGFGGIYIK